VTTTTGTSHTFSVGRNEFAYYVVTAFHDGVESPYSNWAATDGTSEGGGGNNETPPEAPTSLVSGVQKKGKKIKVNLSWDANVPAPQYYRIYRSNVSGSGYTMVAEITGDSANYTDANVQSGVSYYYVVTAANDVFESGHSNETQATTP
jgi:fibronectin type 3 domain-containing protein